MTTITSAFLILVVSAVVVSLNQERGEDLRGQNASWILALFVLYFVVGIAVLGLGSVATKKFPRAKTFFYHLTGVVFSLCAVVVRLLLASDLTPSYWLEPVSQIRLFVVLLVIYYLLHISLGLANLRLSEETRQANLARAALEVQRGRLIVAQEETRRQISDFLHDRLQSDLVVLGMQMNRASEALEPEGRRVALAFIDEIERIRQIDVRDASRALAPDLDGTTITPALNDLVRQYSSVIDVEVSVNQQASIAKQQRLGIYRVVEQGLLNAAKHGGATQVTVEVSISATSIEITVLNNGSELPEQLVAGSGFAIIETWVNEFLGTWAIENTPLGTKLSITMGSLT